MRLLVINSNTSTIVTDRIARAARDIASAGTELIFATSSFGGAVIATRTEDAIAAHATVDLVARHGTGCDGVLIGVSYDSGLHAARELLGRPVLALAQASMLAAQMLGSRIGLVAWGVGAAALYHETVASYGLSSHVCGLRRVNVPVPTDDEGERALDDALLAASRDLVEKEDAEVIVLMGAVLSGASFRMENSLTVPVLDGVRCGLPMLEAMVRIAPKPASSGSYAFRGERVSNGLSPSLQDQLSRRRTSRRAIRSPSREGS